MKISPIEAMVFDALNEGASRQAERERRQENCKVRGHVMEYSMLYRCYRCRVCGHSSRSETGEDTHPMFDRD